jgi:uncharacterized protein YfaS (alpha-2-macroglobulin family)
VLSSQVTDATGRARLPSSAGLVREKARQWCWCARKAGDMSFLPLNRARPADLDLSRFDVGGAAVLHGLPNQIQAYLFSDRGIYRPGDTMNIGIDRQVHQLGAKAGRSAGGGGSD